MSQLTVSVSEFRTNMSEFLQQVKSGKVIRLTHRGSEIAKLVPPDFAQIAARQELVKLRETAEVGDVLSPINETKIQNQ
ncbi:MAG: type II toxin-antitoxin system prevent-host-death family antitoxin [Candidatus Promineifilaceae bacterium]